MVAATDSLGDSFALILPEREMRGFVNRQTLAEAAVMFALVGPFPTKYLLSCQHETCPKPLGYLYDIIETTWMVFQDNQESTIPCLYGGIFIYAGVPFTPNRFRCRVIEADGKAVSFEALSH